MKALPGNPYEGHTLATVIPAATGPNLGKIVADAGYRRHNAPKERCSRSMSPAVGAASPRASNGRCDARPPSNRSSAISSRPPQGRQLLAFTDGDANNAMLAVGYNFSLLLNWLRLLFAFFLALLATAPASPVEPRSP